MSKPAWPQPSPSPNQPATTNIDSHDDKTPSNSNEPAPKLLIASPYTTPTHLLPLDTLDQPTQLLARALTILAPTRDDYATAPYAASFNWPAVFARLQDLCTAHGCPWRGAREFCAVVFRSRLRAGADGEWLHVLDERSHEEACASGGLLKYWFGVADWRGDNLATCRCASVCLFRVL
jgi:hypothetical protein